MRKHKQKSKRSIMRCAAAMLLPLMTAAVLLCASAVSYAGGSRITVRMGRIDGLADSAEFRFSIYKVGSFDGDSVVPDESISSSGAAVVLPGQKQNGDPYNDSGYWNSEWMYSAAAVDAVIEGLDEEDRPPKAGGAAVLKLRQRGSFSIYVPEDGVYLLTGTSATIDGVVWHPLPMYIVVNSDESISLITNTESVVKLESYPPPDKHTLIKQWAGDGDFKDSTRPGSVAVKILYGGVTVDTVTLDNSNNWNYTWRSETAGSEMMYYCDETDNTTVKSSVLNEQNDWKTTFTPGSGDRRWTVVEVFDGGRGSEDIEDMTKLRSGYSVTLRKTAGPDSETFRITNKYKGPVPDKPGEPGKDKGEETEKPAEKTIGSSTGDTNRLNAAAAAGTAALAVLILMLLRRHRVQCMEKKDPSESTSAERKSNE